MSLTLLALAGCAPHHDRAAVKALIASQCGGCHVVPGVKRAVGRVGPRLTDIAHQQLIAGRLPNSRANLALWITHAQEIDPGGAMPAIPLSAGQAAAVADYLLHPDH